MLLLIHYYDIANFSISQVLTVDIFLQNSSAKQFIKIFLYYPYLETFLQGILYNLMYIIKMNFSADSQESVMFFQKQH